MGNKQATNRLRATAFHEAGHYVAKWVLRGEEAYGDTITIIPNSVEGTLGACVPLYEDNDTEKDIRAYIVSLYAGAIAECRASSDPEYVSEGSYSDDKEAGEYLHLLPESEQELRDQTRAIIDKHWQVVVRVANELLKCGSLDADEAFFLVDNDLEALEEYRRLKG